jgi:hypothetical protein
MALAGTSASISADTCGLIGSSVRPGRFNASIALMRLPS